MSRLYSIGELSKATGVPVSTLRYYCNEGLLVPAKINDVTGYRYFDEYQFWSVELIKMCRDLKIPICAIKEVMVYQETRNILCILDKTAEGIYSEMKHLINTLKSLTWLKNRVNSREYEYANSFEICKLPAHTVLMATSEIGDQNYKLQIRAKDILNARPSLERYYGYYLDQEKFFENSEVFVMGKYLKLESDELKLANNKTLFTIPSGEYLITYQKIFHDEFDVSPISKFLQENSYQGQKIFASSASFPVLDWKKIYYKVSILLSHN